MLTVVNDGRDEITCLCGHHKNEMRFSEKERRGHAHHQLDPVLSVVVVVDVVFFIPFMSVNIILSSTAPSTVAELAFRC